MTTVVRVQPRPSKGITDLFLTLPSCALSTCPGSPAGVSQLPGLNPKVTPLVVNGHAPLSDLSCTTLVRSSGLVSCPALSQIKPHTPLLVVFFRQFPLNFSLARVLSPGPYSISLPRRSLRTAPRHRHRLLLELQRSLIIFDPLAYVLYHRNRPCTALSPLLLLSESSNFTSRRLITCAPAAPYSLLFRRCAPLE